MRNPLPLLYEITRGLAYGARKRAPWFMWMWIREGAARLRRRPGPFRVRVDGGVVWTPTFDQALFLTNEIFIEGCYRMPLPARPLILDCGANAGTSLLFFARAFPDSRLVAFEPDPDAFELLGRTVRENRITVEVHQLALGREEGIATIQTDGPASVHATLSDAEPEGVTVRVVRLSPYVPAEGVDLLKLDVEGSELRVLEELRDAQALSRVRALVAEVHPELGVPTEVVRALLEEDGFTVKGERLLSAVRPPSDSDLG